MFQEQLENVRAHAPLIHCITNYVTVNDCANLLLACGASPIMADEELEVAEITSHCNGLVLNLGTLNRQTCAAMLTAGKAANRLGIPVVLDPVGVGASRLRSETAAQLLQSVQLTAIRGNVSEIRTLLQEGDGTHGVDANASDRLTKDALPRAADFAKRAAAKTGAVIAMTGEIDVVSNAEKTFLLYNGTPMMRQVTGTGCMLSALVAAYLAANRKAPLEAAAAAVCSMGMCGETAQARMTEQDGNASFRTYLIDAVCRLTGKALERSAHYAVC